MDKTRQLLLETTENIRRLQARTPYTPPSYSILNFSVIYFLYFVSSGCTVHTESIANTIAKANAWRAQLSYQTADNRGQRLTEGQCKHTSQKTSATELKKTY